MFAYCLNNPINFIDSGGHLPHKNDIIGSCYMAYEGSGISGWNPGVTIPSLDLEDESISYALIEESVEVTHGVKTAKFLSGSVEGFNVDYEGLTLLSADLTVISLDLDMGNVELAVFDLGNAELAAEIKGGCPKAVAMLSVWDPSICVNFGEIAFTIGAHVGAIGAEASLVPGDLRIGFAYGFGAYFAVTW